MTRRWIITGVSGGFGRRLAEAALARGESVAGTLRRPEQRDAFEALAPGRAHAVLLDVTERSAIQTALDEAIARLGGLDILVNNAGYGLVGALEELDEQEIDHCLATNLQGTLYTTRAALPALRASGGHILNVSSMAGFIGFPGMSVYCAAKYAVEGLSEALAVELAPFGIRVTIVEPGAFRTNFASGSERVARAPLPLYDDTPAGGSRKIFLTYGGSEPGDPAKAVEAMLTVVDSPKPPLRLVLGKDALAAFHGKLAAMNENIAAWEHLTRSTDFTA